MAMKVAELMTREVITVSPEASILEAGRVMLQHEISGLPVVDCSNNLVGIVSEGDFLRRRETGTERHRARWLEFLVGPGKLAAEYTRESGRKVSDVMTMGVHTATEDMPLEQAVHIMEKFRIKRLPVVRGNMLVGMITRANIMRAVARLAYEVQPETVDDAQLRTKVNEALKRLSWAPEISVAVRNGSVQLSGVIIDERQRAVLRVAAENIAGVKNVSDDLVWIDPRSGMVLYHLV
jgi:CBS domain-containing protein